MAMKIPVKTLSQVVYPLCGLDVFLTTLFFLLGSGSPPFSDFHKLWQEQVVHYKYHTSVADALLLSWFRAAPGVFSFYRISKHYDESPEAAKGLIRTAGFMVFKTGLSFLAVFSKASYFTSWDSTWVPVTLIFTVSCSFVELILAVLILIGVRRVANSKGQGADTSSLYEPLVGKDVEEGAVPQSEGPEAAGEQNTKKGKASVYRLLSLAKPERPLIIVGTIALFLSSAATMALPYFIGRLIDDVQVEINDSDASTADAKHRLTTSTLELLAILLLGSLATFIRGTLFNMAGERLVARIRRQLFAKIITMDISFFDQSKTGELMNRLASDTTMIQSACTSNTSMFLRFFLQVVFSTVLLFFTSWKLTLVMFAVIPALVIITRLYSGITRKLSKRYQDALASSSDVAQETLSNVRTVRSFGAEGVESGKYNQRVDESYQLGFKKAIAYGAFTGGIGALAYCAMLVVLWYGGVQVIEGKITAGTLTSFLLYTVYIATGLSVISGLISEWMQAVGASERMFELFDKKVEVRLTGGTPANSIEGKITFQDVGFRYPARDDVTVLENFNLTIEPNTTVALVGHSGAGKSTVLALLQRYYDVTGGRVLVDGVDLRSYDMTSLRRHMAVVSQEPVLFGSTIKENIAYGLIAQGEPMPSDDRIEEVARIANCHEFITRFPESYDTVVGERGIRLSGGQKQRICIARALLVNPRILLLDEATSALDAESEHLVREAIDRLMVGRTVIIIAHRLSTVRGATTIVVMSDGSISGLGKHAELLEQNEIYRQLVKYQLQSEREDEDD